MKYELTLTLVVASVLLACAFLLVRIETATAAPQPGLWQESVMQADGVTVRKIRDTMGGEFNVCYVASQRSHGGYDASIAVSISCLPEKKP